MGFEAEKRKKVTRGLEACQVEEDGYTTLCKANGCPYNASSTHCMTNLHKDALVLLKEQENGVKPKISKEEDGYTWYYCGKCGYEIDPSYENYCPTCGTKIKLKEEK